MRTVVVQIGNSDDKLSQHRWSDFFETVSYALKRCAHRIHFSGASPSTAAWQNALWLFEIEYEEIETLKKVLQKIRIEFEQESIAWTEGLTEFIV